MYLDRKVMEIVKFVAHIIHELFPNRLDRRMSIGDACNPYNECKNHPNGSHTGGFSLDLNYYTFNEFNTTQYQPGKKGDPIWERTKIFYPGCTYLPNPRQFDWQRNYICWWIFKQIFPGFKVMSSDTIYDYMYAEIMKFYGIQKATEFKYFVMKTGKTTYNHHTHDHLMFRKKINKINIK